MEFIPKIILLRLWHPQTFPPCCLPVTRCLSRMLCEVNTQPLFPLSFSRCSTYSSSFTQAHTHTHNLCRILFHSDFFLWNRLKIFPSKTHKEKTPPVVFRISIQLISLPSPLTSAAAPDGGEHMVPPRIVWLSRLWNPTPSYRMRSQEQVLSGAPQQGSVSAWGTQSVHSTAKSSLKFSQALS